MNLHLLESNLDHQGNRKVMKISLLRIYLPLWLIAAVIVMALVNISAPIIYPYTSDGLGYIEAAQNLLAGNGLLVTPFDPEPYDIDLEPLRLFPPGYPVLIAGASLLGFDVAKAALGISIFAWIALLPAIVFCLRPLIGVIPASICGLLTILSAPAFTTGPMAFADIPFLLVTCLCFGILFRSVDENPSREGILLAGLLAGVAYSLRNAGISILLSVSAAFVLAAMARMLRLRPAMTMLGLWWAGVLPVLVLLWVRNIVVFGKMQPYSHPPAPAETGLLHIMRQYSESVLFVLTGSHKIAMLAWDYKILAVIVLPVTAATAWGIMSRWSRMSLQARFAVIAICFYVVIGSAMVLLAHYLMGAHDYGTGRYAVQYTWLILALVAIAWSTIKWQRQIIGTLAGVAVIFALISSQGYFIFEFSQKKPFSRKLLLSDEELFSTVRAIPDNALIVTNLVGYLKLETGKHVRNLEISGMPDAGAYMKNLSITLEDIAKNTNRPVYGVILPIDAFLKPEHDGRWQDIFLGTLPNDFTLLRRTKHMLLIQYMSHSSHIPLHTP